MTRGVGGHGPANIMEHLKGIHFPATKPEILRQAKNGPGPDTSDVMEILEQISDQEYESPAEIMKEIGRIE